MGQPLDVRKYWHFSIAPLPKDPDAPTEDLSRRERQIMDVVYARAQTGTTAEDVAALADPPTRTAVHTSCGCSKTADFWREKRGRAFVYKPARRPHNVGKSAFRRVVETFFGGSLEKALYDHIWPIPPPTFPTRKSNGPIEALIQQKKGGTDMPSISTGTALWMIDLTLRAAPSASSPWPA